MNSFELNYNQFLRNFGENKTVQDYFKTRNLSDKIIKNNLIAFCPSYSRYEFPLLKGRLIVPIRDVHGNFIALAGRQIPDLKEQTVQAFWDLYGHEPAKCADKINKWNKGKWINEPYQKNKNLFFLDIAKTMARQKNYLILTEGYFDVYSFYDNGIENVVALCGTAMSDHQIALASRYCDNLIVLMDGDDAGKIASEKVVNKIEELGLKAIRIFLPAGMDPDDFAQKFDVSLLDETILKMIDTGKKTLSIRAENG
jgi:DNA primase